MVVCSITVVISRTVGCDYDLGSVLEVVKELGCYQEFYFGVLSPLLGSRVFFGSLDCERICRLGSYFHNLSHARVARVERGVEWSRRKLCTVAGLHVHGCCT